MISKSLIDESIPILTGKETIDEVLRLMEDARLGALPLITDGKLISVLNEDLLMGQIDDQLNVSYLPTVQSPMVSANSHWFEAVSVYKKSKLEIIPVLDEKLGYIGCIKSQTLLEKFTEMLAFNSVGAILIVQIDERNYSLSDISRIIESNGGKILSASLFQDNEAENLVHLEMKLDSDDASRIVAALQRYNHNVVARFQNSFYQDADQDRLNQFLRYINI
ncbi:MAG: CBS domain-containing protein [Cytophagales bacterium]